MRLKRESPVDTNQPNVRYRTDADTVIRALLAPCRPREVRRHQILMHFESVRRAERHVPFRTGHLLEHQRIGLAAEMERIGHVGDLYRAY